MPDTFTANYNMTKPEPNASRDTWGTKWNANLDTIDGVLKSLSNNKLQYDPTNKQSSADVDFVGPRPRVGGKRIVTTGYIPTGLIAMWSGAANAIPAGWALCNGLNGTPDLRDRFIVGAGGGYGVGVTGGATTHAHGIHATALAVEHLPPHSHAVNDPGHNHGVNDPGHTHDYTRANNTGYSTSISSGSIDQIKFNGATTSRGYTGIYLNASGTGIWLSNTGSGWGHSHGMDAADSRPPFYALCFIMKLAATDAVD